MFCRSVFKDDLCLALLAVNNVSVRSSRGSDPLTVRLLSQPVELKLIFAVSIFDALILDLKSLQDNLCLVSMSLLQRLTSLVPTSLWILARFSGLAKHKSRYLTKLYSITTNCNSLKYRGIRLKEVNVDFFIVI